MPLMDGQETLARIRGAQAPWSDVPVIVVTADAMAGDRERYLAMGMDGYVAKPIDLHDLLIEVDQVLYAAGARRAARPARQAPSRFDLTVPPPLKPSDDLESLFVQSSPEDERKTPMEQDFAVAMATMKPEWTASVLADLKRLTEQLANKETALVDAQTLHRASHDWKGQAQLFGYGMAGLIAADLSERLRDRNGMLEGAERIAALRYLAALSLILSRGVEGDGGESGREIRAKLAA
jgi:CheY-like chemotaxis protein